MSISSNKPVRYSSTLIKNARFSKLIYCPTRILKIGEKYTVFWATGDVHIHFALQEHLPTIIRVRGHDTDL